MGAAPQRAPRNGNSERGVGGVGGVGSLLRGNSPRQPDDPDVTLRSLLGVDEKLQSLSPLRSFLWHATTFNVVTLHLELQLHRNVDLRSMFVCLFAGSVGQIYPLHFCLDNMQRSSG